MASQLVEAQHLHCIWRLYSIVLLWRQAGRIFHVHVWKTSDACSLYIALLRSRYSSGFHGCCLGLTSAILGETISAIGLFHVALV